MSASPPHLELLTRVSASSSCYLWASGPHPPAAPREAVSSIGGKCSGTPRTDTEQVPTHPGLHRDPISGPSASLTAFRPLSSLRILSQADHCFHLLASLFTAPVCLLENGSKSLSLVRSLPFCLCRFCHSSLIFTYFLTTFPTGASPLMSQCVFFVIMSLLCLLCNA